ncbi:MAG: PIN domain nuclease [Acidobacteria bacterium]|nr:MAG: PIN domain nuclease [Acidobacteriota bacterium]
MKSFVDSNVVVYLFDQDSPKKKAAAQRILQTEASVGNILLSTQVLQEFYVTVSRKLAKPLKPETALEAVTRFSAFPLVIVDMPLILSAIRRSQKDSISFWDSLAIDAALKGGAQRLWSEDLQHGRMVNGMRIENPFL